MILFIIAFKTLFQQLLNEDQHLIITLDMEGGAGMCETDGWYVDWIKVYLGQAIYRCEVKQFYDYGDDQLGPSKGSFTCSQLQTTGNLHF